MKQAIQRAIESALRTAGVDVETVVDDGDRALFVLRRPWQPAARVALIVETYMDHERYAAVYGFENAPDHTTMSHPFEVEQLDADHLRSLTLTGPMAADAPVLAGAVSAVFEAMAAPAEP
jgi:hypothetical protein